MKKKLQDNGLGDKWLIKLEWKMKIKIQFIEIELGYVLAIRYIIMNFNISNEYNGICTREVVKTTLFVPYPHFKIT